MIIKDLNEDKKTTTSVEGKHKHGDEQKVRSFIRKD